MRKFIITAILISGVFISSYAQEKFIDHLSIGINYGTTSMAGIKPAHYLPFVRPTDGAGIEVAAQMTDWLEARAGFSTTMHDNDVYSYSVEGVPNGQYITQKLEVAGKYGVLSGSLFFDFYPFRNTSFHFTAGAYAGSNNLLKVYSYTPVNTGLASFNAGVLEMKGLTIPTDRNGMIDARLKMAAVRPYLGVGISTGRMNSDFVVFSFRLGAMYKGNNGVTVEGPDGSDVEVDYWPTDDVYSRLVKWNKKCPVAPMLSLSLYFRIF